MNLLINLKLLLRSQWPYFFTKTPESSCHNAYIHKYTEYDCCGFNTIRLLTYATLKTAYLLNFVAKGSKISDVTFRWSSVYKHSSTVVKVTDLELLITYASSLLYLLMLYLFQCIFLLKGLMTEELCISNFYTMRCLRTNRQNEYFIA